MWILGICFVIGCFIIALGLEGAAEKIKEGYQAEKDTLDKNNPPKWRVGEP